MKFNDFQKRCLAFRRQRRDLEKAGYRMHETDWEILRGGRHDEIIIDVKISTCGKYVYTKLGKPNEIFQQIFGSEASGDGAHQ